MTRMLGRYCAAMMVVSVFLPGIAVAQTRDGALEAVQNLTVQLMERTGNGTASDDQVWAGVQALTDALHRFVLAETEIRADEKVAPPAISALRPGQSETPANTNPGNPVSLSSVPTPWFNLHATEANSALEMLREGVEQNVPRPELTARMGAVLSALSLINRPPA